MTVGAEIDVTLELVFTDVPLDLAGVDGAMTWESAVGQFVSGAAKGGSVSIYMVGADQTPSFAALFAAIGPPIGPAPGAPLTGLGGNTILLPLANPLLDPIGPLPVLGGGIGASAALPPGVPAGTQVFLQWFVLKGSGGYQASDGLAFTVGSS